MDCTSKMLIRDQIIDAARIYGRYLAGHSFLYVFGNSYFELSFPVDRFKHLTGVNSDTPTKLFYQDAKKGSLTINQIYFDKRYLYDLANRKLPCLLRLVELTNSKIIILKKLKTESVVYKLSLTNLDFTLALVEKKDVNGKIICNNFVPMSLRVDDKVIEKSTDHVYVDFIFSKDASVAKYDNLLVCNSWLTIPKNINNLISSEYYK